mgnify:CR=1 FL=1
MALGISRRFAGGVPRAGDVPFGVGPIVVGGVDTIDVSALSTEYLALNHSSYAEKTGLLKDIELVLRTGTRPLRDFAYRCSSASRAVRAITGAIRSKRRPGGTRLLLSRGQSA